MTAYRYEPLVAVKPIAKQVMAMAQLTPCAEPYE
jgi:hypothetical protein